MEKISFKIIKPDEMGIFHDSRKDVRTLAKVVNLLIDKVNTLIEENNKLNRIVGVQESDTTEADSSTKV